jgi:hypothetical protein
MSDSTYGDLWKYHHRVAAMERDGRVWGYLFVELNEVPHGRPTVTMDFYRGSLDDDEPWRFSDRHDPDDYDTFQELKSGLVDWYDKEFQLRWLADEDADRVRVAVRSPGMPWRKIFGRSRRSEHGKKSVADRGWGDVDA